MNQSVKSSILLPTPLLGPWNLKNRAQSQHTGSWLGALNWVEGLEGFSLSHIVRNERQRFQKSTNWRKNYFFKVCTAFCFVIFRPNHCRHLPFLPTVSTSRFLNTHTHTLPRTHSTTLFTAPKGEAVVYSDLEPLAPGGEEIFQNVWLENGDMVSVSNNYQNTLTSQKITSTKMSLWYNLPLSINPLNDFWLKRHLYKTIRLDGHKTVFLFIPL